jgi:ribA/ribD-fused uncharacterized protein
MKAVLSFDKLIVDAIVYTIEKLSQLPLDHCLNPDKVATPKINDDFIAFFTAASPLSNHRSSNMIINGVKYHCNEQFYLCSQARYLGEHTIAKKIMDASSARECKYLSDNIRGTNNRSKWFDDGAAQECMKQGLYEKFKQNKELCDFLLSTGNKKLVEANINDTYWAVGLSLKQKDLIADPSKWKGRNHLGLLLEEVRTELREAL